MSSETPTSLRRQRQKLLHTSMVMNAEAKVLEDKAATLRRDAADYGAIALVLEAMARKEEEKEEEEHKDGHTVWLFHTGDTSGEAVCSKCGKTMQELGIDPMGG